MTFSAIGQQTTTSLSGLKESVTVRRDARSIPYIEAKNDGDLYFTQGYITASDRLWQMDLMRRVARGELSELFGSRTLDEDKRWRKFGFAKIAEESLAKLTPQLRAGLEDYARGVNAYIATLDDKSLPVEFKILQYKPREWTPSDTIVIGKILADALSSTWRQDLLRLQLDKLPKDKLADLTNRVTPNDVVLYGKDTEVKKATAMARVQQAEPGAVATGLNVSDSSQKALLASADYDEHVRQRSLERVGLYAEDLAASNNWVVSGTRTADGKPLLANDPHLEPTAPGIWYLTHLTSPGMRVSGVTIPGVPGIILGHNEYIAWGATNVGPDVQDIYAETFDDKGQYKTSSGFVSPVTRTETINVRTSPLKTDVEKVSLDVVETRNGVIITEDAGKKYALKWTARDPANSEFGSFYYLNRAKDWSEFTKALGTYGGAAQNFVFADVKGHIGWYAAGKIPIRKTGDGEMPYDGSTDDGDWTGFIPFEELPHLYDPPSGFIVTANQRTVGTDYKYTQFIRDAAPPWRARRIYELLAKDKAVTMDAITRIQLDVFNRPVKGVAAEVVRVNGADAATLELFKKWDGFMLPDSKAALLANEIRTCIGSKIAADNPGVPTYLILARVVDRGLMNRLPNYWLPKQYSNYAALISACSTEASAGLPAKFGVDPEKWTWSAMSKSRFPHPLASAPLIGAQFATPSVGIPGSRETPNVGSYVSMRHIASPGNWDATRHVIPLGESGDSTSLHYKDQFDLWRTGDAAVFPFAAKAVEAAAKSVTVFSPK